MLVPAQITITSNTSPLVLDVLPSSEDFFGGYTEDCWCMCNTSSAFSCNKTMKKGPKVDLVKEHVNNTFKRKCLKQHGC